jgi:Ca2+ transporting ATPase
MAPDKIMSKSPNKLRADQYVEIPIIVQQAEINSDISPKLFGVTPEQLSEFVDKYRERVFAEEIDLATQMGGIDQIGQALLTDFHHGLSDKEDQTARIHKYSSNKRPEPKRMSFLQYCWEAFGDLILRILAILGLLSLAIGVSPISSHPETEWIDGFAIILAVCIVVLVTAYNDYQKSKKFDQLQKSYKQRQNITILRDGAMRQIHPSEVLVGDIVILSDGNIVPADGIIISSDNLEIDESALTGENDKMKKASLQDCIIAREAFLASHVGFDPKSGGVFHHEVPSPICISGTTLVEGRGKMLILAVGKYSVEGRIMDISAQEESSTPLQKKLDKIASDVSKLGMACATFAVVVLFLRFGIELGIGNMTWETGSGIQEIIHYILVGITVLVVAIPEGLPLAVTISLAYSVQKMQKENNLVKRLHACETMGGADMICSDKTGTLTSNDMKAAAFVVETDYLDIERRQVSSSTFVPEYLALLKEAICVNTTAYISDEEDPTHPGKKRETGSKTELAMIKMLIDLGHGDYLAIRDFYINKFHKMYPFSSTRKRSSIIITTNEGGLRAHIKGASEVILALCKDMIQTNGRAKKNIDQETRIRLLDLINQANMKGMRTICLAYREVEPGFPIDANDDEGNPLIESTNLTLLGILGIRDPIRPEVPEAVAKCHHAGIRVRMVTGDNEITAKAIARDCRIILSDENNRVIKGVEFYNRVGGVVCKNCRTKECDCPRNAKEAQSKNQEIREDVVTNFEAFKEIIEDIDVMARSRPEDKYALVTGLMMMGHVVAVTGDGTNDAPALRKASIGFAMGISGTELAKETADIILLDDNFNSIVVAVKWGRNIYDNIRKFIQFQLTVNIVAVTAAIIGAVTIKQSPLTAVQMLWVNLIMDTFASLALATEEPNEKLLNRAPYKKDEYIVSRTMWKNIIGQAVLEITIILVFLYAGEWFLPEFGSGDSIMYNPETDSTVRSGRNYHFDGSDDYKEYYDDKGPSRHLTYVFNVFVLLQLFNEFNCRRIHGEKNVFEGILRSYMFLFIWILVMGLQILMIEVGSYAFSTHLEGLTIEQWLVCIAFGILPLPWRFILMLIPTQIFKEYGKEELDIQKEGPGPLVIRRSSQSIARRHSSIQPM